MKYITLFILVLFTGCSSQEDTKHTNYQQVKGRNQEISYQINAPKDWKKIDPETPPLDTKLPICEFYIEDPEGSIRITVHNFPSKSLEDRIPPLSQIARWKKQLNMQSENITPQSFSGYVGYLFEGDDGETAMMGWIMQLGPQQYSRLTFQDIPAEWRSDVTIKAQGPLSLMQKNRHNITRFARSFELVQEIPFAS
jgi:hypothetical protein